MLPHFAVGDVPQPVSRLLTRATARGAQVTNRPLFQSDRRSIAPGSKAICRPVWDAELYRNGELLAFSRSPARALAAHISMMCAMIYGDNRSKSSSTAPGATAKPVRGDQRPQNQVPAARPGIGRVSISRARTCSADITAGTITATHRTTPKLAFQAARSAGGGPGRNMAWANARRSACWQPPCSRPRDK